MYIDKSEIRVQIYQYDTVSWLAYQNLVTLKLIWVEFSNLVHMFGPINLKLSLITFSVNGANWGNSIWNSILIVGMEFGVCVALESIFLDCLWLRGKCSNSPGKSVLLRLVDTFCSHFQKKCFVRSQVCRMVLIRSALESTDPGASNGGSNFEFQPLGVNLVSFEVSNGKIHQR